MRERRREAREGKNEGSLKEQVGTIEGGGQERESMGESREGGRVKGGSI